MENKWNKSSRCSTGACVEVKFDTHLVSVRDAAKDSILMFTYPEWEAFIEGVKNNEFDV